MSKINYDTLPLVNNDKGNKGRFELTLDGRTAFIEYNLVRGNVMYLTHTEVPSQLEGQGVGTAIVKKVLHHIRENNLKVAPLCPFVAAFFKKHPNLADGVLAEGFHIK